MGNTIRVEKGLCSFGVLRVMEISSNPTCNQQYTAQQASTGDWGGLSYFSLKRTGVLTSSCELQADAELVYHTSTKLLLNRPRTHGTPPNSSVRFCCVLRCLVT